MTFKNSLVLKGSFALAIALSAAPQAVRAEGHGGSTQEFQGEGDDIVRLPRVRCPPGVRCLPRPAEGPRFISIEGKEATALREIIEAAGAQVEELRLNKTSRVSVSDGTLCQGQGKNFFCELHDANSGRTLRLEGELLRRWADIIKKYAKDGDLPKVDCSRETVNVPVFQGEKARYPMKMVSATSDRCQVTLPPPYQMM